MLADLQSIAGRAAERNYAVAAFNVFGFEDASAVVRAAELLEAPVILAANVPAIRHMPVHLMGPLLRGIAERSSVPVCVHLDHGGDFHTVMQAVRHGFSSVMYDGSQLPFEENVRRTREIAKAAHAFGVSVEAEIGSVGYSDPALNMKHELSDPEETARFVDETGIDAVAVSVGTVHRMERQGAAIDFARLEAIQEKVSVPLVIHGASGVPDEIFERLVSTRVGKINIGTALRMSFGEALREELRRQPEEYDRVRLFAGPMAAVQETAARKIRLLGCGGRGR
ncbi:class II fructose-bisphosphate aldolase [Cohnella fermenti]|uniref:Class II fructose-bisphosphate aldolase family protein n=1 Tax=Cohnella fermenti TaxID=2565925 RepID=A0A4S4C9A7_9BACL|nr:class II fructose-bisphosphate aldolase [Cohnella fermenti]THF84639.1 class II fructose-bisphosphate aldolase family protein [Cohnella fermenti]